MAFTLAGRTALVTGSSAGLGRAIALRLGRAGARIAINYHRQEARAKQVLEEARDTGMEALLVRADVTSASEVRALHAEICARLGPVDILVLNASREHPQRPIEELHWEDYQRAVEDFLKAPYLLTRTCLPDMKTRRWGRLITISSDVLFRNVNHYTAYVAGKGAEIGFTRALATELAPFGITANTVAPGWVPVERHVAEPGYEEKRRAYETTRVPMGRVGVPADVAEAVLYFASDEASFVTGQYVCINGGVSLM
jgi:3-oxoacyl-[acyl-carrier protein] reductase